MDSASSAQKTATGANQISEFPVVQMSSRSATVARDAIPLNMFCTTCTPVLLGLLHVLYIVFCSLTSVIERTKALVLVFDICSKAPAP